MARWGEISRGRRESIFFRLHRIYIFFSVLITPALASLQPSFFSATFCFAEILMISLCFVRCVDSSPRCSLRELEAFHYPGIRRRARGWCCRIAPPFPNSFPLCFVYPALCTLGLSLFSLFAIDPASPLFSRNTTSITTSPPHHFLYLIGSYTFVSHIHHRHLSFAIFPTLFLQSSHSC